MFEATHPDRLRVLGKMHGLSPAPAETARVLEIGCGEGFNLLGLAAAYPQAHFEGFDLAATAIAAGQAQASAAGLDNVHLYVGNILDLAETIAPGSFDYIVAHGVYAWVPEIVREAVLALCARALSPHGIAYVSYNAMPGGHFRMLMRDLLLHEVGHITDPAEKIAAARGALTEWSEMDAGKEMSVQCIKILSQSLLEKDTTVLFHDEMGAIYAPHSLTAMVANGARAGLRYLTDSEFIRAGESFIGEGDDASGDPAEIDRVMIRRVQSADNRDVCFFRTSLFVRSDAPVSRVLDLAVFDDLWVSTDLTYDAENEGFHGDEGRKVKFGDAPIQTAFHQIVAAAPGRLPVRDVLQDERWRAVFMQLLLRGFITLHASPAPFVTEIGEQPEVSGFVRFVIGQGPAPLPRLDHRFVNIEQENLRALLLAANGERTIAEIARVVDGVFPADEIVPALNAMARLALIRR